MKKARLLNLELLRILCIFSIIIGHFGYNGKIALPQLYAAIAPFDVNCFYIISGYFLITSKFKAERLVRTMAMTIFYSFAITLILYYYDKASLTDLAKSIMPFAPTKFSYWFVNKYLAVILLSPFICIVCTNISKTQYRILLISLLLISSVLLPIFPLGNLFGNSSSFLWTVTLFITGGYFKLHQNNFRHWGYATILLLALYNICFIYQNDYISIKNNSLITYALSITTFMWFKKLQIPNTGSVAKATLFIAPHVFAAYLIHAHVLARTGFVELLNYFNGYLPSIICLYILGIAVIIFSALIDKIRMLLFKYSGIDYITNKVSIIVNRIYEAN